jgi:hypothetical protein
MIRILTDRGSEYCSNRESHEYALYLDLEHRTHSHANKKPADQRDLKNVPDYPERVLR